MKRTREPELMDNPDLDVKSHQEALRGLARINAFTGAANIIWQPLRKLCIEKNLQHLSVLDIATGSGDMPVALYNLAKHENILLDITATDFSQTALQTAQARFDSENLPIKTQVVHALEGDFGSFDVVMTSLFTHHLSDNEVTTLLLQMKKAAKQLVIVNDLVRSQLNLLLVYLGTRTLSHSPVVHFDGPASVRNAFTVQELESLASKAGLACSIEKKFPARMVLVWRNPNG